MKIRNLTAGVTLAGAMLAPLAAIPAAHAATYPSSSYTQTYSHTATYQEWRQQWKWTYGASNYNVQTDTEKRDGTGAGYNEAVTEWHPSVHHITKHTLETSWTKAGKVTYKNQWSYS